jgi:hypothetical protein
MQPRTKWQQKGQSLVEVAIFLPVALIIIAGLVELSLYLVTQNKVNTATREAARFGANGGENAGMVTVALNTVTQTLQLEVDRWDMWSVRGRLTATCQGSDTILSFGPNDQDFEVEHSFGISSTVAFTETSNYVNSPAFRVDVRDRLVEPVSIGTCDANNPAPDLNGLQFVAMYSAHDVESILGLDVFLESVFTVKALHVFRVTGVVSNDQSRGCDAFPIGLQDDLRSMTEAQYNVILGGNQNQHYPAVLPTYQSLRQQGHNQEHPLLNGALEGDVFLFTGEGFDQFNYTWLQWSYCQGAQGCNDGHIRLKASMTWPGNTTDPTLGFREAGDVTDTELHINDRVNVSTAQGTAVSAEVEGHIDRRRTLRIILWHVTGVIQGGGQGNSDLRYIRVARFANVRLLAYDFSGSSTQRWLLVQFVNYDDSCGQVTATTP